MRIIFKGKRVPMARVTWNMLSHPKTVITSQDPGVEWPEEIRKKMARNPGRAATIMDKVEEKA